MRIPLPQVADQLRQSLAYDQHFLESERLDQLLEAGRRWDLSPVLRSGGAVSFPHAKLAICGHQIASAVHGALDCGADQLLVVGVLHPMTNALWDSRARMQQGMDVSQESMRGIQGAGRDCGQEWRSEYSLACFLWMLETEASNRAVRPPRVISRYPFLAAGHPETLPGIGEIEQLAKDSAILVTGDLMHHGAIYGDDSAASIPLGAEAEELARTQIGTGLDLLSRQDFDAYRTHAFAVRSDAEDVGQLLRHLIGPFDWTLHDMVLCETSGLYGFPPPNWVAAPLVGFEKATDEHRWFQAWRGPT